MELCMYIEYLGVKPAEWREAIQEVEAHSDHLQLRKYRWEAIPEVR